MRATGLLALVGTSDGKWMAGGVTPSGADPTKADYCRNAREVEHSHFFRSDGSFGSSDENGETVDDGVYLLIDPQTFAIGTATVRFQVDGSGRLQFLSVSGPADCPAECRQDMGWATSAFYPGMYERAPSIAPTITPLDDGTIVFTRYDTVADAGKAFAIDPDGTHEVQIGTGDVDCPAWSQVRHKLLCSAWFARTGARPATANLDGSGFAVLDAYPDRKMSLGCSDWLADDTRFLCVSDWDRNATKADFGLYTLRASDGGDVQRVTTPPSGCVDQDTVLSPDGEHVAFVRFCGGDEHGILFVVRLDGTVLVQLSPSEAFVSDAFGRLAAGWSPDGSKLAFGALLPAVDSTALYVVDADGTHLRQIVPTDIGAVSARWSPDGRWIAFTSRYRSQPQVWVVHPDGSGLTKLTGGAGGMDSVAPSWSPDGGWLVFTTVKDGTEGPGELEIMRSDGTGRAHVADLPHMDVGTWIAAPDR